MKTAKLLLTSCIMMFVLTVSATRTTENSNSDMNSTVIKQCGVSNAQICDYLRNCSHHHTVNWVQDIPGTCNSLAGVNGCQVSTVYVEGGSIIGHLDSQGVCE